MSLKLTGVLIAALFGASLHAGSLTVTVKDPGQALVADAAVEVAAADNITQRQSTDSSGRATFEQLTAGSYRVAVTKEGFATWEGSVKVGDRTASLAVALKLSAVSSSVRVTARRSPLANSDPNYQALRTGKLSKVYQVSNLVLTRDSGTFTFRSGSFSFLPPVLGHVTTGVFVGDGNFQMKPTGDLAVVRLKRMMGSDSVSEDFTAMVVFFSDSTFDEVKEHSQILDASPLQHEEELKRVRSVIQGRREPRETWPRSQMELLLNYEDIPNYDAEILAEIYNGAVGERAGSFRAFLHGQKYSDLRFLLNPHGAMPVLQAPEEVALINFNPNSNSDGVWYLSHTLAELRAGRADSKEEKRLIAADRYKMEVLIGDRNLLGVQPDLAVTCELSFHPIEDGVRMAKFELVPDLQVSRVTWNGSEIPFVQESRNHDGSFYLQAPEPLKKGNVYNVTFEYAGGEILQTRYDFFGIPPRRIWYPTPAGPASRGAYDLKFRIAHGNKVVSVGNQVGFTRDGDWDVSEWKSDAPITQAVFRWLEDATVMTEVEETTKSQISLYRALTARGFQPPSGNYMLGDIGNALRLFNSWFGKSAYDNLTFLVQTGGPVESLPGLVYARPVLMMGSGAVASRIGMPLPSGMRAGLDEAFPRLMAGQWWGNTVTAASFHDEWLTAGLTNFSASVYDLDDRARGNDVFQDRWVNAREAILTRAYKSAIRPNDAGPVWMGILNNTPAAPAAGWMLNASKGAFIVQMLRAMMWDPQSLDRDFQAMMQDFVATFRNQAVSSEDFQAIVEKHMKPAMDLTGDHRMDWYFNEWLRSTDVPSYRLEYSLSPAENGSTMLEGKLTQSGVSDSFRMLVPVFAEAGEKNYRVCVVALQGNSSGECKAVLSARPKQVLLNANHDVLADKEMVSLAKPGGRQ
jgi:hypothetical protein